MSYGTYLQLTVLVSALGLAIAGCSGKKKDQEDQTGESAGAGGGDTAGEGEPEAASLPDETERIALDEGESEIPATVEVPKGATTFNDTPTTIRVSHGDGEAFGIQVKEGNEFNLDLAEFEEDLLENKYGTTNEVIEKNDTLLVWKATTDGHESHKFRLIVELADKKWVCTQGNYGGWTKKQVDRQLEACKTLKAK